MLAVDVNVIVPAFRPDMAGHDDMRVWLEDATNGPEQLGVSDVVLGGVVRLLTHPRVFAKPTKRDRALAQVASLRDHPGVTTLSPGRRHWQIFSELCRTGDASGNLVSDAQHAALAVEHGATWISNDRDFARFPGLRWRRPLD